VTDFHRRLRPEASDRSCLRLARWLIVVVGGIGTGVAVALTRFDIRSLWETFLGIIGLFGGTISGLFVLGIFSRRAGGAGALVGAVASAALVFAVRHFTAAHFFVYPVVGVVSCAGLGWLVSLWLPRPTSSLAGLTLYTLRPALPDNVNRHSS
jgi:Na+/proline symporter